MLEMRKVSLEITVRQELWGRQSLGDGLIEFIVIGCGRVIYWVLGEFICVVNFFIYIFYDIKIYGSKNKKKISNLARFLVHM